MVLRVEFQGYTIATISRTELDKAIAAGTITDYNPDRHGTGYADINGTERGRQQIRIVVTTEAVGSQDLINRVNRMFYY